MIRLQDVTIAAGAFCLSGVNFCVPQGGYGVLMGATGCGKTTMLEAICGLRPVVAGTVFVQEQDVTSLPPAARNIGFVPQDLALFPAMRVDQQIEYSLRVRKVPVVERRARTSELAKRLGIESILQRYPAGLSGGERQRVAIARALAFRPALLCLDEPLSSLDEGRRSRTMELLQQIHEQEQLTVLHITHHELEASHLATLRLAMVDGKVVAS